MFNDFPNLNQNTSGKPTLDVDKLLSEGWDLKDIPWMHEGLFKSITTAMGEVNKEYYILGGSVSKPPKKEHLIMRGQILLSEQAKANLTKWKDGGEMSAALKANPEWVGG